MHRRLAVVAVLVLAVGCSDGPADLLERADVCEGEIEESEGIAACDTGMGGVGRIVADFPGNLELQVAMTLDAGDMLPIVVGDGWMMIGTDGAALLQASNRLDAEMIRDQCQGQRWLGIPETSC